MKSLFFVFLVITLFNSSCQEQENDLITTTFKRTFNKDIISSYLTSNDPVKIEAALLSVSHSKDTSFIPLITSVPFNENARMICFAIGQIGPCYSSAKFLWEKSITEQMSNNSRYIFEAIGKTGSKIDLDKICNMYSRFDGLRFPYSGISLALRQFVFRGITNDRAVQVLSDEVTNRINSAQERNEALFTLARTGSSDQINDELKSILLLPQTNDADTVKLKQFALMNFRTQKYFPEYEDVLKNVLSEESVLLKIEAARSLSFRKIKTQLDLDLYLKYLSDDNPNVSRAAASSVLNLKTDSDALREYSKSKIEILIMLELTPNTLGELLLSYADLFNDKPASLNQEFLLEERIPTMYWYNYLGRFNDDTDVLFLLISEYNSKNSLKERMSIITNLLNFQGTFRSNEELSTLLINALKTNDTPLVSIVADGIDSFLIAKNSNVIKNIILAQVERELNNSDFIEGIMSLVNLAEKIDKDFYNVVIKKTKFSHLYSLRKFISDKTGEDYQGEKDLKNLEEIIKYSFKYKSAEIHTVKGNFVIKFLPEYAPVSVGNFCYLAEKNFYNDLEFHRVVPGFVIQCGDPTGTGWGGPGYEIISETSPLNYEIGMVGMASAGKDTEGSQWFVMQGNYPHLNGRYSIFGNVISGMDVVYNIDQNDIIIDVKLHH